MPTFPWGSRARFPGATMSARLSRCETKSGHRGDPAPRVRTAAVEPALSSAALLSERPRTQSLATYRPLAVLARCPPRFVSWSAHKAALGPTRGLRIPDAGCGVTRNYATCADEGANSRPSPCEFAVRPTPPDHLTRTIPLTCIFRERESGRRDSNPRPSPWQPYLHPWT